MLSFNPINNSNLYEPVKPIYSDHNQITSTVINKDNKLSLNNDISFEVLVDNPISPSFTDENGDIEILTDLEIENANKAIEQQNTVSNNEQWTTVSNNRKKNNKSNDTVPNSRTRNAYASAYQSKPAPKTQPHAQATSARAQHIARIQPIARTAIASTNVPQKRTVEQTKIPFHTIRIIPSTSQPSVQPQPIAQKAAAPARVAPTKREAIQTPPQHKPETHTKAPVTLVKSQNLSATAMTQNHVEEEEKVAHIDPNTFPLTKSISNQSTEGRVPISKLKGLFNKALIVTLSFEKTSKSKRVFVILENKRLCQLFFSQSSIHRVGLEKVPGSGMRTPYEDVARMAEKSKGLIEWPAVHVVAYRHDPSEEVVISVSDDHKRIFALSSYLVKDENKRIQMCFHDGLVKIENNKSKTWSMKIDERLEGSGMSHPRSTLPPKDEVYQ